MLPFKNKYYLNLTKCSKLLHYKSSALSIKTRFYSAYNIYIFNNESKIQKMKKYICTILLSILLLFLKTSAQKKAFIESLGPYTEFTDTENPYNHSTRPRGFMLDLVVNVLSSGNLGSGSFDFFDFLRDSYPLPGGK